MSSRLVLESVSVRKLVISCNCNTIRLTPFLQCYLTTVVLIGAGGNEVRNGGGARSGLCEESLCILGSGLRSRLRRRLRAWTSGGYRGRGAGRRTDSRSRCRHRDLASRLLLGE